MRIKKKYIVLVIIVIAAIALAVPTGPQPGHVFDEAALAGVKASALNPIAQVNVANDYFHDMDRGASLTTKNEINGRNMWLLWTAGNDRFWDLSANLSFGNVDLLKTLSSYDPDKDSSLSDVRRQELKSIYRFRRDNRWSYFGMVNEPCYEQANEGDQQRFGLWLDRRAANCGPDPFADEAKYPGVKIGARGRNVPVGSYYGYGSGVVGLRLFPNPEFDDAAQKKWDPVRFYTDASYYKDPKLIRPFRVGMSCGFCHVSPNPVHPPPDPEHPAWEHLSSTAGAQYLWMDRVFSWESKPDNFLVQLFHTWRPGTLDVSFVSQDNIDNPRTMNAIYNVGARMHQAAKFGKETLADENKDNLQLNNFVPPGSPLAAFYKSPDTVYTMHVLKDGSDSVGVIGALNRVYLNIGTFSEEWLLHFRPLLGGQRITPIAVKDLRRNSVYWQATEAQTFDMAAFLLKAGVPHRLSEVDPKLVQPVSALGKNVFGERCLRCHSSKLPTAPAEANLAACSGNYLDCWNRYWRWTKTDDFKTQARAIASQPDFLEDNYLSTDFRVPITLLQTNACSPLATNAIAGNIWSEFSSETYKSLPSVGDITYYQPFTGEKRMFHMPGGGRGYTRPPSLVSVWATAPYLLNNSVGTFQPSPAVDARLKTFDESIGQMLWPERREKDSVLGDKIPGMIERTSVPSYLRVSDAYLPSPVRPLLGVSATLLPALFSANGPQPGVVLGPFPTGMPVEMLANLQMTLDQGSMLDGLRLDADVLSAVSKLYSALKGARGKTDEEARRIVFAPEVVDALMKVSKCPDYIVNRGHYFGTGRLGGEQPLTDEEKLALISFLRTF
jgi:hypothetical protein